MRIDKGSGQCKMHKMSPKSGRGLGFSSHATLKSILGWRCQSHPFGEGRRIGSGGQNGDTWRNYRLFETNYCRCKSSLFQGWDQVWITSIFEGWDPWWSLMVYGYLWVFTPCPTCPLKRSEKCFEDQNDSPGVSGELLDSPGCLGHGAWERNIDLIKRYKKRTG